MKALVLYHPNSEHGRIVEEYARDFERRNSHPLHLESLETREGAATATLYDVVQYPAILVTADDGQMVKQWNGEQLPLMDELAGYLAS